MNKAHDDPNLSLLGTFGRTPFFLGTLGDHERFAPRQNPPKTPYARRAMNAVGGAMEALKATALCDESS